jgi:hypothetical protein
MAGDNGVFSIGYICRIEVVKATQEHIKNKVEIGAWLYCPKALLKLSKLTEPPRYQQKSESQSIGARVSARCPKEDCSLKTGTSSLEDFQTF